MSFISRISGVVSDIRNKIIPKQPVISPKATVTQSFMHDFIAPHDAYELASDSIDNINEDIQDNLFGEPNNKNSINKLSFIA